MDYLNCKKLSTSINRARKMLVERVNKIGLYENFGQNEIRNIKFKFLLLEEMGTQKYEMNQNIIKGFEDWCSTYSLCNN